MEENKETAQTNVDEQQGAGVQNDPQPADVEKVATEPTGEAQQQGQEEAEVQEPEEQPKQAQSKEENAEFARKRREQEQQARIDKAKEEARTQAIIEIVGKNPYTDEKLENETDVRIYEAMKAYERNGGDPVKDQAKIIKSVMREERDSFEKETKAFKEKQEEEAKAKSEVAEFKSKYPNIDINALLKDEAFADYAEGKLGKRTLTQLYEGFQKLHGGVAQQKQPDVAVRQKANEKAGVGSVHSEPTNPSGIISKQQFAQMSQEERVKNYDAILKSMQHWD